MSSLLDQLKNQFKNEDSRNNSGVRGNYYPFWNIPLDSSATVRFLPDLNKENPMMFMVELKTHNLEINGERKTVPCLKMYGEKSCPICEVSSNYYNQKDEVTGKKYYRKIQHLVQALVVKDPIQYKEDEEPAEGTVKILKIDFKIYNIIKQAFTSGDLDEVPYAYEGGTDFVITKTQQGKWSDYSLSKFARRSTDLSDEQIEFCEEHLIDLATLIPANPGIDKIDSMLRASLTGEIMDEEDDVPDFGKVTKKKPVESLDEDEVPTKSSKKPVVEEDDEDEVPTKSSKKPVVEEDDENSDEEDEIIARIKRRRAAKAAGE